MHTSEPDARAVRQVLAVAPALRGLQHAGEVLGLGKHELLHAGPPIRNPGAACAPIAHSAITAILFEAWAETVDEAAALLRSGDVRLRPAQDSGCVVPLADVVSPSMWVQEVCDLCSPASVEWAPLNGGAEHVLRVGVLDEKVLEHLRWINGPFAYAFRRALKEEPIPLLTLADSGIVGGDDCHGRTGVATSMLASELERRWTGADATACREFLGRASSFFLNMWMAASKCMLNAARGIAGASIVTAAGGNGTEFGIQIASKPGAWFSASAEAPAVTPGILPADAGPLGAIGDSAIVDCFGHGAMTTPTRGGDAARPPFADLMPEAISVSRQLFAAAHPGFPRTEPLVILPAMRVVQSKQVPVVSLGVLDKAGQRGRLAGGFYRPPLAIFTRAVSGLGI